MVGIPPVQTSWTAGADRGQSPLSAILEAVVSVNTSTTLNIVVSDIWSQLETVTTDLGIEYSTTGDGKRIASSNAYVGALSTAAWSAACADPSYQLMKRGSDSFTDRWDDVRGKLTEVPYRYYVSLGPGDGRKDTAILRDLLARNPDVCYLPVDVSTEMLELAKRTVIRDLRLPRDHVIPFQLDFSSVEQLAQLREVFDKCLVDTPVIFSLLGNTLANFDDDKLLLLQLTTCLMRPNDRLLLEVATTDALSDRLADSAAREYKGSRAFREFATSGLGQFTDLSVEPDAVQYRGAVEPDHALVIKVVYCNRGSVSIPITLPGHNQVEFTPGDTIRLVLTRKYIDAGIEALLAAAGVRTITRSSGIKYSPARLSAASFGMDVLLLELGGHRGPTAQIPAGQSVAAPNVTEQSMAGRVWQD